MDREISNSSHHVHCPKAIVLNREGEEAGVCEWGYDFAPKGHLSMSGDILVVTLRGGVLLASGW